MTSSSATIPIVTSSSVTSAPSNAAARSAPNAGPPVTSRLIPSGACAAMAVRRALIAVAVSALSAPTVIGADRTAALPSSLTTGSPAPAASPTGRRLSRSPAESSPPSSRVATTIAA